MRWKEKESGDFKYKLRFLLFPKTLNGETRWLELCWIYSEYCIISWFDYCFADWKWRSEEEGTWLPKYKNSFRIDNYRVAECSLCGHEESFKHYTLPEICPKCGWEKEGDDNEAEL